MLNVTVGTVRKSIAIVPSRWLRRKVFHVCDGGRRGRGGGFGMYFATVSCAPGEAWSKRKEVAPETSKSSSRVKVPSAQGWRSPGGASLASCGREAADEA